MTGFFPVFYHQSFDGRIEEKTKEIEKSYAGFYLSRIGNNEGNKT